MLMDADEPVNDDGASDNAQSQNEVERAVEVLAEGYLSRLRRGESENFDQLVKQYPDLAPHLEERLKIYLAIFRATRLPETSIEEQPADMTADFSYAASPTTRLQREFAYRIRCPHCGNQVQVVGDGVQELTCGSCGSSVRVKSKSRKSSSDSTPLPMPEKLGHFRIVRVLGEGGFGIVYLAEDENLANRQVAIKIPRHGFFATVDEEQRFFREARNVARLKHANIAQVHEISEDRNTPFIVSEFIDGLTLRDVIRNGNPQRQDWVKLLIQVAEAVQFAHNNRIIHRDLKTSNILIDHDQNAFVVDFGLSRREDAEITMTMEGAVVGTVQYMSPEQAAGKQSEVGPHSDIYSLGVILYEMLCKELPFNGSNRMVLDQVIHDEPRSPHRLNETVPKDLETITLKAMAKMPSQRYASAQDFADDLKRWLRGEPILARPVSTFARYWSWCRRHPTTTALSATIAALLLTSSVISLGWALEQSRLTGLALAAIRESENRHYELLMQNGTTALEDNDLANSMLWFSEALTTKDNAINRTRIGLIQDRLPKLNHLWSTGSGIDAIEFNESGTRLAVASFEGQIEVFDTLSRKGVFEQKLSPFSMIQFSATGSHLVTCGYENHAQLWDVDRSRLVKLLAHTDLVVSTSFHTTSQLLATGSFDSFARVWNAANGAMQKERQFEGLRVNRVVFVPGTDWLVVVTSQAHQSQEQLHIWDYLNDKLVASGLEHTDHVLTIDFADDGSKMCSASRDGQIQVWGLPSGERVGSEMRLPFSPRRVFFGGSAQEVVSISYDFDVEVWNIVTGKRERPQIRGPAKYESAQLDPSNRLLALGGGDGTVSIFWQKNGAPACSILRNGESATAIAFHPDGRRLAVGGRDGVLQLWDLAGASPKSQVFQHAGAVRNALFSPDGSRCFTIGNDGRAFIWNVESGQHVDAAITHTRAISECALSRDGKLFATASIDETVKLWDGYTGSQVGSPLEHHSPVLTIAISPTGEQLVTGCLDGSVTCWAIKPQLNGVSAPAFIGKHERRIFAVAYSPKGDLIASASMDGTLRCWDSVSGQQKYGPFVHPSSANDCSFMPDGMHLISSGSNGQVYVWDLATGEILQRLQCAGDVISVSLFADGGRLSTSESKGRTRLWRLLNGQSQFEYDIQHSAIEAVDYSESNRDASILAFAGGSLAHGINMPQSGAALLWDLAEHRPLGPPLHHLASVRRIHFDTTGKKVVTASDDHTARLWSIVGTDLPVADAIGLAQVYSQMTHDSNGLLRKSSPTQQLKEFAILSEKYPQFFRCDADEIKLWNDDARRQHELKSTEH